MTDPAVVAAGCCAVAAAGAAALAMPSRPRLWAPAPAVSLAPADGRGWMLRHRWAWSGLGGAGAAVFVGGGPGAAVGLVAAVVLWVVIGRSEPPELRRDREAVRRELPQVVALLGAALQGGAAVPEALHLVGTALPGAAARRLGAVEARLAVGVDPALVWRALLSDPELAPLGRALARAHDSGAPVVGAVEQLAGELTGRARADVEDRARAVGVRAAVPLGLCLLPAFVLLGIVPLVAGLASTLAW